MINRVDQPESRSQKVGRYFYRAARLRCPVCGISPLFRPARRTESLTDWFETLPGCPRCRYPYQREAGYYLFPLWMASFGIVSVCGLVDVLTLGYILKLSTPWLMLFTLFPVLAVTLLAVRHIKAFFLALDHLIHPHFDEFNDLSEERRPEPQKKSDRADSV